jgi:membrane protease YdiL (CAAX protease family)
MIGFPGLEKFGSLMIALLIVLIILAVLIRYTYEKLISKGFKQAGLERTSIQIFIRAILLVLFNLVILKLFGLLGSNLLSFSEPRTGFIILAIGFGIALLLSLLSYMAIKAGHAGGYGILVTESWLDRALNLVTFAFLVGPSEDLFFIGFIQNMFSHALGGWAILIYLLFFQAYHLANVLSGVENKKEFLAILPVRLIVSSLLGVSFYLTGSLMWGMVVHNLVDTFSYVTLLVFNKSNWQQKDS